MARRLGLPKLNKKASLRVALVTACAFLFAQYGALAHAYSHLHSTSTSTYLLDAHGKQCADCLTFAPLLSTAGAPVSEPFVAPQSVSPDPASAADSLIARRFSASYSSRAPPISR